jgi:hypothetical protein
VRRTRHDPLTRVVSPSPPSWLLEVEPVPDDIVMVPSAVRMAVRAWARGRADRLIRGDFAVRSLAGALAAAPPRARTTRIYAASLTARHAFSLAARGGPGERILVEDLPDLRRLQADLDAGAAALPQSQFLRRFRADREVLVRQEAERALATHLVVRTAFARRCRIDAGFDPARITVLATIDRDAVSPRPSSDDGPPLVLLAGPAVARNGIFEALALAEALPDIVLGVQPSEGMEPTGVLRRRNVRVATPTELSQLAGVAVVIAPAWCETGTDHVARARCAGVPAVATDRAGGTLEPGDVVGLIEGVVTALA